MNDRGQRIAITGGGGFLGFHTRALLQSTGDSTIGVAVGESFDWEAALNAIDGADRLIHLAGVNRGFDDQVRDANTEFARQLAGVIYKCEKPPPVVVFANSIQAGNGSIYGEAKREAAETLLGAAEVAGSVFLDLSLPNLFGEHGRPFYNSATATFCHLLAARETPELQQDKLLTLLHAQDAAELLTGMRPSESLSASVVERSVGELLSVLTHMADTYRDGTIPRLESRFDRDLFNTYRSYLHPEDRAFYLNKNADSRGSFFEVLRSQGSSSQMSFSTTVPGVTRGQHYHRRKIERFTVLSGKGEISMRKLFTNEILNFKVDGDAPVAVDMPTLWAHNVSNTGPDLLFTAFWTNELFDAQDPDTFPEEV